MYSVIDGDCREEGALGMHGINHPNIVEVQREIVFDGSRWKHMLIVLTDLPLDPQEPGYSVSSLNEIIQRVQVDATGRKARFSGISIRNP